MDNFQEQVLSEQNNHQETEESQALQHCQTQLQDTKNKYLHLIADFDNFKKRQEKERAQWTRVAQMDVIAPLLTVIDDFDRAFEEKTKTVSPELTQWFQGFELIHKELFKYLEKIGVQEIKVSSHDSFNPELHESVMTVQSDVPSDHIVEVLQKGYTFKGSVLRPAKVSIAQ
jgi:molecular chaperone GrpE